MKEWLDLVTEQAILVINVMALIVVVFGSVEAFIRAFGLVVLRSQNLAPRVVWLRYSRLLVAALTFQLAADIIETSISTDWESLGRIVVIGVIRTFLNYFLEKDLADLREHKDEAAT